MRKIISAAVLALSLATANQLYAFYDNDQRFYFDSGVSYHKFTLSNKIRNFKMDNSRLYKGDDVGVNFIFGRRFDNVGVEVGYTIMSTNEYYNSYGTRLKHENSNFSVDANYYHQLTSPLVLKSGVGLGLLQTKTTYHFLNTHGHNSEAELKPRAGVGLQYNFNKEWSADLSYNYQAGNQYYKAMQSSLLSATYRF